MLENYEAMKIYGFADLGIDGVHAVTGYVAISLVVFTHSRLPSSLPHPQKRSSASRIVFFVQACGQERDNNNVRPPADACAGKV